MSNPKTREWVCQECDWIGSPEEWQQDGPGDGCPNCGPLELEEMEVEDE